MHDEFFAMATLGTERALLGWTDGRGITDVIGTWEHFDF